MRPVVYHDPTSRRLLIGCESPQFVLEQVRALDRGGPLQVATRGLCRSARRPQLDGRAVSLDGRLPAASMRTVLARPSATSTLEMVRSLLLPSGVSGLGGG